MYPDKEEAEKLLSEAGKCNPGPWIKHSRTAAYCAESIARYAGLDSDKAYVLGLLHDIGRKFGVTHLKHVYDGYTYMMSLGYDDAARICLTHSFNENRIEAYVGKFDTTEEETNLIRRKLRETEQDDYDKLIQLCDAIAGTEGVMDIIDRMTDVRKRYGFYDPDKWEINLNLKNILKTGWGKTCILQWIRIITGRNRQREIQRSYDTGRSRMTLFSGSSHETDYCQQQ